MHQKSLYEDQNPVDFFPMEAICSLNLKQRQIYDLFMGKCQDILHGMEDLDQLLINIDGEGGSEKSYLIKLLFSHLLQVAEHNSKNPIFRAAPTGIAAHGINGHTIHGLLRLPVRGKFQELSSATLSDLQNKFDQVYFLIYDRKSMIGLQILGMMDQCLWQIRPSHCNDYMGGFHCLLLGDSGQLPPVLQKPLYYSDPLSIPLEIAGQNAYMAFDKTIRLTIAMRQQGDSQTAFRTALSHFREASSITEIDWCLLSPRMALNIPNAFNIFLNATRIYSTVETVHGYNSGR